MSTQFWLEKGWGDSVDNVTFKDIEIAIEETINMDEEHGAFWIGNMENEYVLEVHKGLKMIFILGEDQMTKRLNNWDEAKKLFLLFFRNEFVQIQNEFNDK